MSGILMTVTADIQSTAEAVEGFLKSLPTRLLELSARIVLTLVIFFIGMQVIRLLRKIVKNSMTRANVNLGAVQFVDSFIKAALHVILIFMLAVSFGVDAASIATLIGSAGVAIGLAVQGGLSNLVGGVMLLVLQPFNVGDYIIADDGHEGTVDKIQIFYTTLLTPDSRTIVLPNGALANNSLVNVTSTQMRRLDIPVSIAYSADLKKAKEVLKAILEQDDKTLKDHEMLVVVDELADSCVKLILRCWFLNEDYWPGKWRLTEKVKLALDENGIEIPFPQVDVHMRN